MTVSLDGEGQGVSPEPAEISDATASTDVNDAVSSTAEGANAPETKTEEFDALAVTRKALDLPDKSKEGDGASPGSDAKDGNPPPADKPKDGATDEDDQDDASLPFHKHPRWQKVLGQKNEYRRKVQELEPDAQEYRRVMSFMDSNRLTAQEVQNGFAIMAAMRNNPEQAYELLKPYVAGLEAIVGVKLPPDLQQRVDEGLLDEASAQELARHRGREVVTAEQRAAQAERETQMREQAASEARVNAANAYVEELRGKDPDFALVEPLLEGQIQAAIQRRMQTGRPIRTPADVRETVDDAYQAVKTTLKRIAPPRSQPVRNPPSSMSSSTPARPAPRSALDVTKQALGLA